MMLIMHLCQMDKAPIVRTGCVQMDADSEFMQQAIELATENVTSGRGGPFGAVIVKDGKVIATGANQVTATQRSDGACGGDGDPQCVRGAGDVSAGWLRDVYQLRALPDVPGGDLLGAVPDDLLRHATRRMRRRPASTMRFCMRR